MDVQKLETLPPPPGVFGSLKAGFDVVSNRVILILLPFVLDLLLWLGPRFSVDGLLSPYLRLVFTQARRGVAEADLERFLQYQSIMTEWLQNFNLLSLLSKLQLFPIGISSLSAQTLPVENPFGLPDVVIVSSIWILLGLAVVLIPAGWIGGGVYFSSRLRGLLRVDRLLSYVPLGEHLRRMDQAALEFRNHPGRVAGGLLLTLVLQVIAIVSHFLAGWALGMVGPESS